MADYTISKRGAERVIGFWRDIPRQEAADALLRICTAQPEDAALPQPEEALELAVAAHRIGSLGVCLAIPGDAARVRCMAAGDFTGGRVPEPLQLARLPEGLWASFRVRGPAPEAVPLLCAMAERERYGGEFEATGLCAVLREPTPDPASEDAEFCLDVHIRRIRSARNLPRRREQNLA